MEQALPDMPSDRRTRKRHATRQAISDVATRLFFERGFDQVTIDDIAAATDVGRMTVFNHFPRKEDMFYDQEGEARDLILGAVRSRDMPPLQALQRLARRLVEEDKPFIRFFEGSRRFVETIKASDALKARARQIRDEVTDSLSAALADSVNRPVNDADAQLIAHLLLATWTVAFLQAHDVYRDQGDAEAARSRFLAIVDQGALGMAAAMKDTPYI